MKLIEKKDMLQEMIDNREIYIVDLDHKRIIDSRCLHLELVDKSIQMNILVQD